MATANPGYSITTRSGTQNLQVRYYVPRELQAVVGKNEICRSLRTTDKSAARQRATIEAVKIRQMIDELIARNATAVDAKDYCVPTSEQIKAAARYVYAAQVQMDLDDLGDADSRVMFGRGSKKSAKANKRHIKEVRNRYASGDDSAADPEYWQDEFGFKFGPKDTVLQQEFRQAMVFAYLEAVERWADHDRGKIGKKAGNPLFAGIQFTGCGDEKMPPLPKEATETIQSVSEVHTIESLWPSYEAFVDASVEPRTLAERKAKVDRFVEFIGTATPIAQISKSDARSWRDTLRQMPVQAQKHPRLRMLSPKGAVEANTTLGLDVLGHEAINKYLGSTSLLFKWAEQEGYLDVNVFDGIRVPKPKSGGKRPRASFKVEHLQALFSHPEFTGCRAKKGRGRNEAGSLRIWNWRFWTPLLCLYSGARMHEILQLDVADIGCEDGINFISITDLGSDPRKSLKTKNSRRAIPLHSQLLELGFLKFVKDVGNEGHVRLFPTAKRNSHGSFHNPQKELLKPIAATCPKIDENGRLLTFHSFRHTFIDAVRRKNSPHDFEPITGHASGGVSSRYGMGQTFDLRMRNAIVETVEYSGLRLSALKYSPKSGDILV